MENLGYLVVAYSIIFTVIFLYVVFLWRLQVRLEREMRAMEARLYAVCNELAMPNKLHSPPVA